ncbi:RNA-directed DNA polymerase, eukaryota, reverse transcriptase zinc-binding domain protein [Tanacetum coccineum]
MNILSINSCGTKKGRKRVWIKEMCFKHNVHFLGIQESKMTRLELFRLKSMWGNFNFDYACSMARSRSSGLISMWGPTSFVKDDIWCDDSFIIVKEKWKNSTGECFMINIYGPQDSLAKSNLWNRLMDFMQHHNGNFILFGDMNIVHHEDERFGSSFSHTEANQFNFFIDNSGLIDLPIRGHFFTWMNKAGTELSKLDRFLISEEVLEVLHDICITALDPLCSDHTPLVFNIFKNDFGPIPFKLYNSWLSRDGFNEVVNSAWTSLGNTNDGKNFRSHEKMRSLKAPIKQWLVNVKNSDRTRKHDIMIEIQGIEKIIDDRNATLIDRDKRVQLLFEIDKLDNFDALDLIQKSHIKWDI